MRLAFCFMTNNIERLFSLKKNFIYDVNVAPYIIDSYTLNVLTNPPIAPELFLKKWNVKWKKYHTESPAIDYFSIRQDSLDMAGHSELIYVGDDDFKTRDNFSEVINECFLYMYRNKDCGAIILGANFGEEGKLHGNDIYITNNGHLNTNRGIILRNREKLMDNNFHALGAMEDSVISFTCLMDGYYVARRLHVPVDHIVERNSLRENHENINYDFSFLKNRGIWNKVHNILGGWPDQNVWPKGIWKFYRRMAMVNGFVPRYDQDGHIIR